MRRVARRLESLGHKVPCTWLMLDDDDGDDPSQPAVDLAEIRECDVMIHFSEKPGTPGAARGGRLVELGMAEALGKRIIVVGPGPENIFHQLPGVARVDTSVDAIRILYLSDGGSLNRFDDVLNRKQEG